MVAKQPGSHDLYNRIHVDKVRYLIHENMFLSGILIGAIRRKPEEPTHF